MSSRRCVRPIMLQRIDDDYAKETCKLGEGHSCCRYLSVATGGWSCLKHSEFRGYIDNRVELGTMNARGDNCPGRAE